MLPLLRKTHSGPRMSSAATLNVLSMTGQGHAERSGPLGTLSVEVRTVNNRGFKCSPRVSDSLASLESRMESLARSLIRRGTIHLNVAFRSATSDCVSSLDSAVLQSYYRQLRELQSELGQSGPIDLASLLVLPGVVVSSREIRRDDEELWEFVRVGVVDAIENLNEMRGMEGLAMAVSLQQDCDVIRSHIEAVGALTPRVVDNYRARLHAKIERALVDHNIEVTPFDLLREVQIFADRSDVSEEITRLNSHLNLFLAVLDGENSGSEREPSGRKLDFVIQEMFRETNTIGSKAADAEISAHVVEIKCGIERMRELVQNLE